MQSLFSKARDVAVQAGDIDAAFAAINEIDKSYLADDLRMRADAAIGLTKSIRYIAQRTPFAAELSRMIAKALAADRYDIARSMGELALNSARSTEDPDLQRAAAAQLREVNEAEAAYAGIKRSLAVLADKPTDPVANLAVGRFRCFRKGDWTGGLPLLALGGDANLKDLAAMELAGAKDAPTQVALGDGWWAVAEKESASGKQQIQQHAARWYRAAAPTLTGLTKVMVEKRLRGVVETNPPQAVIAAQQPQDALETGNTAQVFLADLPEKEVNIEYGALGKNGDAGHDDLKVIFNGVSVQHGLAMHPLANKPVSVTYDLSEQDASAFRAAVGLADTAGSYRLEHHLVLIFRVVGDGRELWRSKPVLRAGAPEICNIDIKGVKMLSLHVDCLDDHKWAHAVWVDPVLVKSNH